jgi:hypothetical protein
LCLLRELGHDHSRGRSNFFAAAFFFVRGKRFGPELQGEKSGPNVTSKMEATLASGVARKIHLGLEAHPQNA